MGRSRQETQVGNGVICLVPVSMVNDLVGGQRPIEMNLHNVSMFKHLPSVDCNKPVSSGMSAALAVSGLLAKQGVAITPESLVVGGAITPAANPVFTVLDGTQIGRRVFHETPGYSVFPHSRQGSSSSVDSITRIGTAVIKRMNSGKPRPGQAEGNPERSWRYISRPCNDYRRGSALLITGMSVRPEREEIVYSS